MIDPQPNLLVSIHLAKTGGNTFATILERAATGMYCQFYGPDHPDTALTIEGVDVTPLVAPQNLVDVGHHGLDASHTLLLFDRLLTVPSMGARRSVLQGHLNARKMMARYPNAHFAVWLRDPVDRVVSHYTFWQRLDAEFDDPLYRRVRDEGISIEEFAAEPKVRNGQTWSTGGKPIEDFAFVGITERYDEGLDLFGRMYDVDTTDVVRLNVNPDRTGSGYDIPDETRRVVESYNRRDLELYRQAVERFEMLDGATPKPSGLRQKLADLRDRRRP
jgi:hypothetical protein